MSDDSVKQSAQESWQRFLNPEELKGGLLLTSIYIAGYEMLKASVIDRIKDFFTHGFDEKGWLISEAYKTKVLALEKSPLKASLMWLKDNGVIDDADTEAFWLIRDFRNKVAHELLTFVTAGSVEEYQARFAKMSALLRKIEVWWVVNVEIPTDPDYAGQEIDEAGIQPMSVISLHLMTQIALGSEKEARFYYDEFMKRAGKPAGATSDP